MTKKFKFCEKRHIIGFGEITKIINQNLKSDTETNINLNLYPKDILKKIEVQFGESREEIIRKLQDFIKKNKSFRKARLIRAILYLSNGSEVQIENHIKQAEIDWRDILLWAEYDKNDNPVGCKVQWEKELIGSGKYRHHTENLNFYQENMQI